MRKFFALILIMVLISSTLLMIEFVAATDYPVFVDTSHITKPSPPEFTIALGRPFL